MQNISAEGINIETLNYKDYDRIITIFTRDLGIVKLFVQGANRPKSKRGVLASPLTRGEFIFHRRSGELWRYQDGTILDHHLKIRQSLENIEAALGMLQAIKASQLPEKPAPQLYDLLKLFLAQVAAIANPAALLASFRLKVLKHEGLLDLQQHCATCKEKTSPIIICRGECYCSEHCPEEGLECEEEELLALLCLQHSRSLSQITELPIPPKALDKVDKLFEDTLQGSW
ncbi:MAG: DNA repair protein RecO [Chlamydiota bacterium]